jgi:hypothetical protein
VIWRQFAKLRLVGDLFGAHWRRVMFEGAKKTICKLLLVSFAQYRAIARFVEVKRANAGRN